MFPDWRQKLPLWRRRLRHQRCQTLFHGFFLSRMETRRSHKVPIRVSMEDGLPTGLNSLIENRLSEQLYGRKRCHDAKVSLSSQFLVTFVAKHLKPVVCTGWHTNQRLLYGDHQVEQSLHGQFLQKMMQPSFYHTSGVPEFLRGGASSGKIQTDDWRFVSGSNW